MITLSFIHPNHFRITKSMRHYFWAQSVELNDNKLKKKVNNKTKLLFHNSRA